MTDRSLRIPRPRWIVLIGALFIVIVSWHGAFDRLSDAYLDEALQTGALVYATARAINASVSFLQGTEFTPGFVTLSAGEVLDPLNDLIERFSAILLLALGSLALQKILLAIFDHHAFSLLLTANLGLLAACATARFSRFFGGALRFFLLAALVRFALGLAVLVSGAVDRVFLAGDDDTRRAVMTELDSELSALSDAAPGAPAPAETAAVEEELAAARRLEALQQEEVDRLRSQLEQMNAELDATLEDVPLRCRLNPLCDKGEAVDDKKAGKALLETDLAAAESRRSATEAKVSELREFLACARKQQAGQACSLRERFLGLVSPREWKDRLARLEGMMNNYATNIIALLVSMLAKTILIPLLFLYALLRLYRAVLARGAPGA